MDISTLLILLLLIAAIGFAVYRKLQRDSEAFSRLYKPVDESLLDDPELEGTLSFEGEGWFRTNSFQLEAGQYKLAYWFPEAVMVKVDLFRTEGGDSETIVMKRGEGTETFSIGAAGRYFCVIEPGDEAWEIEISRLGLPSQQS